MHAYTSRHSAQQPESNRRKIILITTLIVLALAIILSGLVYAFYLQKPATKPVPTQAKTKVSPPPSHPVELTSKLLVTGNSFWGRYTHDHAEKSDNPAAWPFARLHEFDKSKYNAWITGLECPVTEKGLKMTSAQMDETLTFNCDPKMLPEFAKWFDIVTLANNHSDNMGADGFAETQKRLADSHIQYFGHYDPEKINDLCDIISLPVDVKQSDGSSKKGMLPVAMCGYHFVFKLPHADALDKINEYAKYFPVILLNHGGAEYKPAPDQIKTDLYRDMIDRGADMILADHPHWVQTTEAYKGKLIVYSMGNFMFDQQDTPEVIRSAAIQLDLKSDSTTDPKVLAEWLKLGKECLPYHDNCFEYAKQHNLPKLKLDYHFGVIATNDKGYQTHPDPSLQSSLEQRLRWKQTMAKLGQTN